MNNMAVKVAEVAALSGLFGAGIISEDLTTLTSCLRAKQVKRDDEI